MSGSISEPRMMTMKQLDHKTKVETVAFVIFLISSLPMFVGFGAFEIIDHFNVRELQDEGDPMAFVWMLSAVVFTILGMCFCAWVTLLALRKMPGMRESMPALWEDEDGEPLPQPKEPKKPTPEGKKKLNRFRYWLTLVLLSLIGLMMGVFMLASDKHWQNFMRWTEEEGLEGLDGIIYNIGEVAILIAFIAVFVYFLHAFFSSSYGSYLKPYLQDPPKDDDQETISEGVDNQ